ncbi:glycine zipper 2TM domain-containing protein, partial [Pseudomonas aeruginosa]
KRHEGIQARVTYTTPDTRCSTVHDSSEKVVGYDVKYMLDGKAGQIRMERDPGSQIPVDKNGRLILSQGEPLRGA